jgi:hypothetical protein
VTRWRYRTLPAGPAEVAKRVERISPLSRGFANKTRFRAPGCRRWKVAGSRSFFGLCEIARPGLVPNAKSASLLQQIDIRQIILSLLRPAIVARLVLGAHQAVGAPMSAERTPYP